MRGLAAVHPAVIVLALGAVACEPPCETGGQCARACALGGRPYCAAHGVCVCVAGGDAEPAGEELDPASVELDGSPSPPVPDGDASMTACRAPTLGDLLINEVLLDGEPTEDEEFVEILNVSGRAIDLAGVRLTSNRGDEQVRRVEFVAGCLAAGQVLALYADRSRWTPALAHAQLTAEVKAFGFANRADFDFRLVDRSEALIDRLTGSGDLIRSGISVNRLPDGSGSALAAHDMLPEAVGGSSPGRCATGAEPGPSCEPRGPSPLETEQQDADGVRAEVPDGSAPGNDAGLTPDLGGSTPDVDEGLPPLDCPLAEPGDIRINEVLIDGVIARTEADEFVEIVNARGEPVSLRQVKLALEQADGPDVRIVFADGCLPVDGVAVLGPQPDTWRFVPAIEPGLIVDTARLTLGNEAVAPLVLLSADDRPIDRFDPRPGPIIEGVSLNRWPEVDGAAVVPHDEIGHGPASPGGCVDGAVVEGGACTVDEAVCAPVDLDVLVVNEVLADGLEDQDADEFVELVNRSASTVDLRGVTLRVGRADGTTEERIAFTRGCLEPDAAIAVFGGVERWQVPDDGWFFRGRAERLGLANDGRVVVALRDPTGAERVVEIPAGIGGPGTSAVRATPGDPESAFESHADRDVPASPGWWLGEAESPR